MIEAFLKYLRFEKRLSVHTIIAYENDLKQFSNFLAIQFQEDKIEEAQYQLIRGWIVSLVELGIEPRSINRKIAALRSFFKYLQRQEVVSKGPMTKVKALKTSKNLPSFIKETEIPQVLDNPSTPFENTFEGQRNSVRRQARPMGKAASRVLVGQNGEVRSMLNPEGFVWVSGALWRARSEDGSRMRVGEPVTVTGLSGEVLTVVRPPDAL